MTDIDATPQRIGPHHRVRRLLARGGMGAVYEVIDERDGRPLALKLMHDDDDDKGARLQALFEREYRTLRGLAHPRIVQAHEYGFDGARPFYTMDLVEGSDLHALAPLDPHKACSYLRDVASALALLHTRGLLHRDLSARNVRATADGHCKLLDFGAVASFGVQTQVVGTPPCIAPETLRRAALDQRTDLFALGALAYWLLTGRHAFPARTLAELPEHWANRPQRPSELAPQREIPRELDALVLQLLALDPTLRPHSTTEVSERLSVIARLPPEAAATQVAIARSYFETPEFVGRAEEQALLHDALHAARAGIGSCWLLRGESGSGRSRLLAELVTQARLRGVTTLSVDAGAHPQARGTAIALLHAALDAAPNAKQAAAAHAELLAQADRGLAARLSLPPSAPDADVSGAWRARVQEAMCGVILDAGTPLLIAVDDLDAADEASLALLHALSYATARVPLVLVATATTEPSEAVEALRSRSRELPVSALGPSEMRALMRSLFAEAPGLARFSSWLHEASSGRPLFALELVKQLFAEDVVRYLDGLWVLPTERPAAAAAVDLGSLLALRFERLSPAARSFAELLAIQRSPLTRERCSALGRASGIEAMPLLTELTRAAVLVDQDPGYRFAQRALSGLLRARLDAQRLRTLHALSARCLLTAAVSGDDPLPQRVEAGFHLLDAGEDSRGADLLAEVAYDHAGVRVAFADVGFVAPAMEAALAVYTRQARSVYERMPLVAALAQAGYYANHEHAQRYGQPALEAVEKVLQIPLARTLQKRMGMNAALSGALLAAFLRFRWERTHAARYGFRDALSQFFSVVTTLTGVAGIQLDSRRAAQITRSLEPFAALPERLTPVGILAFCRLMVGIGVERSVAEAEAAWRLYERFGDPRWYISLQARERRLYRAGILYAVGAVECFRDQGGALRAAAELDKLGLALYAMIAAQLRALHHAFRGERRLFQQHREQVEQHAVRAGSAWQVEQWEPAALLLVQLATFDLVEAKRLADRLSSYERTIPSLARHAQLARLILRTSRLEELPRVVVDLEALLQDSGPRGFVGWGAATGLLGRCLNRLGRHAEARERTARALALVNDADRELVALFLGLEIEHALSLCGLGQHERAARDLDGLLQRHARGDNPLTLGRLHEARALVAQAMEQGAELARHARAAQRYFAATELEVLIARGQALLAPSMQLSSAPPANDHQPVTVTTVAQSEQHAAAIVERLHRATRAASCALWKRTEHVTALLAWSGVPPPERLTAEVTRTLEAAERMDDEGSTTLMDEATRVEEAGAIYLIRDSTSVLGAVALASGTPPSPRLLREVAALMQPQKAPRSA